MTNPTCGTWQRYASKHNPCRCLDCRAAWREYSNSRNRAIAYGRIVPETFIDATRARDHLNAHRANGIGARSLADGSSLSRVTLERIASGRQRLIRPSTEAVILAIHPDPAKLRDRAKVDGTGSRRRLQALMARGWTGVALAARMGCSPENVRQMTRGENGSLTTAGAWRKVRDLYDQLWDVAPPQHSASQRAAAQASRDRAARLGWAPPLAWDDDTIDSPSAEPNLGEAGLSWEKFTLDDLEDCIAWGYDRHGAAERLGVTVSAIEHRCSAKRANRPDLLERLDRNALAREAS